jgi:hypothetical protein
MKTKFAILFIGLGITLATPKLNSEETALFARSNYANKSRIRAAGEARDYHRPLTENEKNDIRYIITTISGKSKFSLLFQQSALNRAGNRTTQVHPLNYLAFIFTDPELKPASQRIERVVWKRFSESMGENLAKEAERQNVFEFISDFAEKIGVDKSQLLAAAQNNRWQDFINIARSQLPPG